MNPINNNVNVKAPRVDSDAGTDTARRVDSGAAARGAGAAAGTESVTFTRTAEELLQLETRLRELPGIDQARVDAIRRSIDDGSYQVDAERIVDSLLRSDRELS